jgi:hypothetical protein
MESERASENGREIGLWSERVWGETGEGRELKGIYWSSQKDNECHQLNVLRR